MAVSWPAQGVPRTTIGQTVSGWGPSSQWPCSHLYLNGDVYFSATMGKTPSMNITLTDVLLLLILATLWVAAASDSITF